MMKPQPGHGREEEDVEGPYSHERSSAPTSRPMWPSRPLPYYRRWSPWIVSAATIACVVTFIVTMYVNDCPRHRSTAGGCTAGFLGRFAFQPIKENPLLGPSSATYVVSFFLASLYISSSSSPV
jgi:hypothetical protein